MIRQIQPYCDYLEFDDENAAKKVKYLNIKISLHFMKLIKIKLQNLQK